MKSTKFLKLSMLLLAGVVMFSCSGDDDEENAPAVTNTLTYDGKEFQITDAYIEDYGPRDPASGDSDVAETHYYSRFYFSDGEFKLVETDTGERFYRSENGTYRINVNLYYPSTTVFGDGEFEYIDRNTATAEDVKNRNVFAWFTLWFDQNGNGIQEFEEEATEIHSAGGKVTIEGSDKHYIVRFEVPMTDGKTVTGNFESDFQFMKYRD